MPQPWPKLQHFARDLEGAWLKHWLQRQREAHFFTWNETSARSAPIEAIVLKIFGTCKVAQLPGVQASSESQ